MYNTILTAYDGSDFSKAAVVESSNWIKRHGGNIILVNAIYFDEEEFALSPDQREKRFETGKQICFQAKDMVMKEFGIQAESIICEGEAPAVIVDIAKEKKADLISMGTHGRKGLKRLIMGSVASGVILNSPVDVLVVKRPCTECTGSYTSLLVAFDGSEFSRNAMKKACSLAKTDGGGITALYVIPRYEEMIGFFRSESIKRSLKAEAEKILAAAGEIALSEGIAVKTEIREGPVGEEVAQAARERKSDLIVVGTYGWRGVNKAIMGSTTERVIMHAPCPVLVTR